MSSSKNRKQRLVAWMIGAALAGPAALQAQTADIADGPLAQPASSVKPNMLLILDDSWSMSRQFMPDYVSSNSNVTAVNCRDSKDGDNTITGDLRDCFPGDPPAMAPEFNTQYYNPDVRYFPAVNFDGSSKGDMNAAATTNWTAVPTDNVSSATENAARKTPHLAGGAFPSASMSSATPTFTHWDLGKPSTPVLTMDLVNGYPDRVWCMAPGDSATDTSRCKTNSAYTYPDSTFGYGRDSSSNRKYKLGAPYYYRILTTEFCNNRALISTPSQTPPGCITSTQPTVFSGSTYNFPAPVRFCDSAALTSCQ